MAMKNTTTIELYNSRVRDLMSMEYRRTRKELEELFNKEAEICRDMQDGLVTHQIWLKCAEDLENTRENIIRKKIEADIWDKAREICFQVADEMEEGK